MRGWVSGTLGLLAVVGVSTIGSAETNLPWSRDSRPAALPPAPGSDAPLPIAPARFPRSARRGAAGASRPLVPAPRPVTGPAGISLPFGMSWRQVLAPTRAHTATSASAPPGTPALPTPSRPAATPPTAPNTTTRPGLLGGAPNLHMVVAILKKMRPPKAAAIVEQWDDPLSVQVLEALPARISSPILAAMPVRLSGRLTRLIAEDRHASSPHAPSHRGMP